MPQQSPVFKDQAVMDFDEINADIETGISSRAFTPQRIAHFNNRFLEPFQV